MKPSVFAATTLAIFGSAVLSMASVQASEGGRCIYDSGYFAKLDPTAYPGCVRLRTLGPAADASPIVYALSDRSVFATSCPVTIILNPHLSGCDRVALNALKEGDLVRVDEWGPDSLELQVLRDGTSVFHSSQPRVFLEPSEVELDKKKVRIGYFAKALVNSSDVKKPGPVPVSYYVYLRNSVQAGRPIRWYDIEVFDSSPACQAEIPGQATAGTTGVACSLGVHDVDPPGLGPKRVLEPPLPRQLPSGGGGEPPPTPEP